MSLYDKASLVLIPSGTKTSKVYSQKPVNGDGDFTFSRSTAATRVNADGNIEKETQNLLLQSNNFQVWSQTTGATTTIGQSGYDGTNDAWLVSKSTTNGSVREFYTFDGSVVTYSVYAKEGTNSWMSLLAGGYIVYYDLGNGALGAIQSGVIDANIISIGSGWYRCSMTINYSGVSTTRIYVSDGNNDNSGTSGSIYIQDAQLEQGLVARDYIETTTAAVEGGITDNVPRLDYTDSSCPALLLEPQRTNLVPQSEYFGASWSESAATITTNASTSPEGAINATELSVSSNAGSAYSNDISVSSSTSYTFTFYVKKGTSTQNYLAIRDQTNAAWIDEDIQYIPAATGWTRIDHTFTTPATCTAVRLYPQRYSAGGTGTTYIYGAQLEAGSYATSYIPTYGSSVTRSRDTGSLNMITAGITTGWTSATLFIEYEKPNTGEGVDTFRMHGTSSNGRAYIYNTGNGFAADWAVAGGHALDENIKVVWRLDSLSEGTRFKNGAKENSGSGTAWSDIRYMYLNNQGLGGTLKIKQIALFPTALTDSECIALTTI